MSLDTVDRLPRKRNQLRRVIGSLRKRNYFCMLVLVGVALLLRLILISNNWPISTSDEGTMDLIGLHIAYRGEHPIFFYGQSYMGPLEAYIGAALFHLFGASVLVLRLGLLLFFALFLLSMYYLTRLLYTKPLALITVGLLSFGSSQMMLHQLEAIGGYPEIVLFGAGIFLLSSQLALSYSASLEQTSRSMQRRRWLMYAFLGFLVGLALWIDQLILPWVVTGGLLLVFFCRRELRKWAGVCLLAGLIIGMLPLIYYNLSAPLENNSLVVLLGLQHAGVNKMVAMHIRSVRKLSGAFLVALPAITGANPLCDFEHLPLFGPTTSQTWQCTALQGSWTLGYLALWLCAVLLAGCALWKLRSQWYRHQTSEQEYSFEDRQRLIRQCARLLLLLSAILTLMLYVDSPASALYPGPTSRYLVCMEIATPALLWPLWRGLNALRASSTRRARILLVCKVAALLFIVTMFLLGTVRTIADIPNAQASNKQQHAFMQDLLHIGVTRFYTEYWTCNRLIFQSDERIICSSLNESLQPALDRYLPYRDMVRSTPHPAYVFPVHTEQVAVLEHKLQSLHVAYQRYEFDGYVVYEPEKKIDDYR